MNKQCRVFELPSGILVEFLGKEPEPTVTWLDRIKVWILRFPFFRGLLFALLSL